MSCDSCDSKPVGFSVNSWKKQLLKEGMVEAAFKSFKFAPSKENGRLRFTEDGPGWGCRSVSQASFSHGGFVDLAPGHARRPRRIFAGPQSSYIGCCWNAEIEAELEYRKNLEALEALLRCLFWSWCAWPAAQCPGRCLYISGSKAWSLNERAASGWQHHPLPG